MSMQILMRFFSDRDSKRT